MKKLFLACLMLLGAIQSWATGQEADVIYLYGEKWMLLGRPLDHVRDVKARLSLALPEARTKSTANPDGIVCIWSVQGTHLQLDSVAVIVGENKLTYPALGLKDSFEKYLNKDHISASWVNGQLRAARGKQLYYEHTGYNRNYSSEIFLTFKNGKMTDMKTFNNNVRTEGFDLTNGKVMQALQDGLDTKEYSELKGSRVLARISDMDINKSGELKDCKVRIIMRKNGYSTELTNHPLEKRVKNALKNLSPWRTLYINGNVIIPHSTFTFPITVE